MASAPIPMPNLLPPMPAVTRILSRFDRDQLAGFIAVAIDLADAMDGDPDIEPDGDEEDGQFTEDEPAAKFAELGYGPGCEIADCGEEDDPNGQCDEDEQNTGSGAFAMCGSSYFGPGCPISDGGD